MNFIMAEASAGTGLGMGTMILWLVVMIGLMYFLMIRPQKNEQKKITAMLNDMEVGDSVVTTGGFYGLVIAITDDDVIVEFGSNKNCRIPMRKTAIAQVEKADAGYGSADEPAAEPKEEKKGFLNLKKKEKES